MCRLRKKRYQLLRWWSNLDRLQPSRLATRMDWVRCNHHLYQLYVNREVRDSVVFTLTALQIRISVDALVRSTLSVEYATDLGSWSTIATKERSGNRTVSPRSQLARAAISPLVLPYKREFERALRARGTAEPQPYLQGEQRQQTIEDRLT